MNSAINIYIPQVKMIDNNKIIRPQIGEQTYQNKYHPLINYNSTNSTSWNTFRQSNANNNRPNIGFKNEPTKQLLQSANINGSASKNIQIKFSYSNSMQSSCMKPMKISSLSSSRKRNKIFDSSYLYKQRNDSQNKLMRSNEENNKNINRVKLINSVQHKIQKQNSQNIIDSPIKSYFMANSLQYKPQQTPFIKQIPLINQPRHFQIISHRQYNPQPPKRITFNYQSNFNNKLHRINSNKSLKYQDKNMQASNEYADIQYHKNYSYVPIEKFDIKRKNNFHDQIKLKNAQQVKYNSSGEDNPSKNKIKKQFSLSKINRFDKVQQSELKEYENPKFAKVIFQSQKIQQKNGQQSPNKNTKSRGLIRYNINKQDDQPSFIESISNQRYFDRSYPSLLKEKKISYHNIEIQNAEDYLHDDKANSHDNIFLGFQGQHTVKHQLFQIIKTESKHIHQDQRKTVINNIIQKDKMETQESISFKKIQNIPFTKKLSINEGKISLSLIAIAVLLFIIQLIS